MSHTLPNVLVHFRVAAKHKLCNTLPCGRRAKCYQHQNTWRIDKGFAGPWAAPQCCKISRRHTLWELTHAPKPNDSELAFSLSLDNALENNKVNTQSDTHTHSHARLSPKPHLAKYKGWPRRHLARPRAGTLVISCDHSIEKKQTHQQQQPVAVVASRKSAL